MATHWVAKCTFQYDTTLPRDAVMINPCFRANLGTGLGDAFCQDLGDRLATWTTFAGPLTVRTYDLEGSKPVFPQGTYTKNPAATPPAVPIPRELAICLSFYGDRNVRRDRGRLFVPAWWAGTTLGLRPSSTARTTILSLRSVFEAAGGADVDWIVWSRAGNKATKVQNVWVDDEWDIQRRRGLRSTTRSTASSTA